MLQLTENAITVLKSRYLVNGESPEDLFWRVARAVAEPERPEDRESRAAAFYEMMASCRFMPNSPTLFNAGTGQGTLSACFVIPIEDTMESIMQAATTSAMIQKYGGGIGYAFSKLRSRGAGIATTHGRACGAVAVMKMLGAISDMITQGGKRHGANMGILHVSHPEIMEFIHVKDDNRTLQNFNISVAVTDEFMQAVKEGKDWQLIDPHSKEVTKTLPARQIWEEIVASAWKTGDPGFYFIDEANRHNPTPHLGNLDSTNPCGEVPLLAHEACNLGSIDLSRFVRHEKGRPRMDLEGLGDITRKAVRFLDNVVTINQFPSPEVHQAVQATRKIGLGVMGWHDALILLGVPYDSPEALDLAERVMGHINKVARETSEELARERGPYPASQGDMVRNATRTCIAPTGSISAIAGCSSGIEPVFALAYVKNVLDGKRLQEVNPYFVDMAKKQGFYSDALMTEVAKTGSLQNVRGVPDDIKRLFRTALEVDYAAHVKMQAAFQRHTDLAVSKTVNLPHAATREDIAKAYWMAYEGKCKGITVYRDGCKPVQVLEVASPDRVPTESGLGQDQSKLTVPGVGVLTTPRVRPQVVRGVTERVRTGHGNMYVTINFDDNGEPFEVFSNLGKAGGCDSAQLEAISRLISLALRSGISAVQIVEQLQGITCCPAWDNGTLVRSAPDAVALALQRHPEFVPIESGPGDPAKAGASNESAQAKGFAAQLGLPMTNGGNGHGNGHGVRQRCPECQGQLAFQEGCLTCHSCGWNRCGG